MLPDNTTIAFHVTSLDVIHGFWAYQLGVKADANPQLDNIAYTSTRPARPFTVRCDELCGLWHGAMFNYGNVVSKSSLLRLGQGDRKRHCAQHQATCRRSPGPTSPTRTVPTVVTTPTTSTHTAIQRSTEPRQ